MSVSEIQQSVVGLSEKERAELAAWLLGLLPSAGGDDAADESLAEAEQRRKELDSGEVTPLTAKEFWDGIDRERSGWR